LNPITLNIVANATFTPTPTSTPTASPTSSPTATPTIPIVPPTPLITMIYRDKSVMPVSSQVDITFDSASGITYDIYESPAFDPPVWNLHSSITATGTSTTWSESYTSERYYRIGIQGGGVYSPNEVGILPVTVMGRGGTEIVQLALLGVSLSPMSGLNINDVIGLLMTGAMAQGDADEIWRWDASLQNYEQSWLFEMNSHPMDDTWLLGAGPSTVDLPLGVGFWARNKQTFDQNILFDGEVSRIETLHDVMPVVATTLHQFATGYVVPIPLDEANTTLVADGATGSAARATSDEIWAWVQGIDNYRQTWLFVLPSHPMNENWMEGGGPTTLTLEPGTAIWYRHKGSTLWTWSIPVPY
jgi:hypothetical protein